LNASHSDLNAVGSMNAILFMNAIAGSHGTVKLLT